jgi:hypothetical protein
MGITTAYPTAIDTFTGVIEQGSQEPTNKIAQAVLALENLSGIIPATSGTAKTVATAATSVTLTVASGSMRQITAINVNTKITLSTAGVTNGQVFTLTRNCAGAYTVAVNAIVTYAATSTTFGSTWQFTRGAWALVGSWRKGSPG